MQPHSTLVTGAVVVLFAAAAGATSPAAADDRALCFGQTATVVGTNGGPILTGTEGDDVVITNGAEVTETDGGDDMVCVTRAASTVQLGLGDDRVDTTALPKQQYVRLELGGGHDVVRGGAAREQVLAGDESASDPDRDNISTGAGFDSVFLDGSEATSHDTVSLGRGTDRVTFVGDLAQASVDDGPGRDLIAFRGSGAGDWVSDNRRERLTRDGARVARWHDFVRFDVGLPGGPVNFVGSAASENVRITVDEPWKVDVRLGGGNDQYIDDASSGGSSFDGGRGIDILISAFGRLPGGGGGLLDLRSGRLEESLGDDRVVTNVCLTNLEGRPRRPLPTGLGTADQLAGDAIETDVEIPWLEPVPDAAVLVVEKESIRLAFVAALQHLPARQRAVLILRDVLRWSAAEVAEALDTTSAAVNSALQRAHAQLADRGLTEETASRDLTADQELLLERYVDAFWRKEIDTIVSMLAADAV